MRPFGGDEEDRTPDPLLAKQVLSQLSYPPNFGGTLKTEQCFSLLRLPSLADSGFNKLALISP